MAVLYFNLNCFYYLGSWVINLLNYFVLGGVMTIKWSLCLYMRPCGEGVSQGVKSEWNVKLIYLNIVWINMWKPTTGGWLNIFFFTGYEGRGVYGPIFIFLITTFWAIFGGLKIQNFNFWKKVCLIDMEAPENAFHLVLNWLSHRMTHPIINRLYCLSCLLAATSALYVTWNEMHMLRFIRWITGNYIHRK